MKLRFLRTLKERDRFTWFRDNLRAIHLWIIVVAIFVQSNLVSCRRRSRTCADLIFGADELRASPEMAPVFVKRINVKPRASILNPTDVLSIENTDLTLSLSLDKKKLSCFRWNEEKKAFVLRKRHQNKSWRKAFRDKDFRWYRRESRLVFVHGNWTVRSSLIPLLADEIKICCYFCLKKSKREWYAQRSRTGKMHPKFEVPWRPGVPSHCRSEQIEIANASGEDAGNYLLRFGDFGMEFKVSVEKREPRPPKILESSRDLDWKVGEKSRKLEVTFAVETENPLVYWLRYNVTIERPEPSDNVSRVVADLTDIIYTNPFAYRKEKELSLHSLVEKNVFKVIKASQSKRIDLSPAFPGPDVFEFPPRFVYSSSIKFRKISRHFYACYICLLMDRANKLSTLVNFCPRVASPLPPPDPPENLLNSQTIVASNLWLRVYLWIGGGVFVFFCLLICFLAICFKRGRKGSYLNSGVSSNSGNRRKAMTAKWIEAKISTLIDVSCLKLGYSNHRPSRNDATDDNDNDDIDDLPLGFSVSQLKLSSSDSGMERSAERQAQGLNVSDDEVTQHLAVL